MQTSASEKKPLLRVSNLKQYFPLKKKGLYVKANDGITLDIFLTIAYALGLEIQIVRQT